MQDMKISYMINGKPCHGEEYLALIEEVFSRNEPQTDDIELQNGDVITLGGNQGYVSTVVHREDGTLWSPNEKSTKEYITTLVKALITGDNHLLADHGVVPSKQQQSVPDFSEKGKIHRVLMRMFITFLGFGVAGTIIWAVMGAQDRLLAPALVFVALALVTLMFGSMTYSIDLLRSNRPRSIPGHYLRIFQVLLLLLCGFLFPLYLIIYLISRLTELL